MSTLTKNPDQPSNAMSANRGRNGISNSNRGCPNCFDNLDAAASNCTRCNPAVSNRQRRNARRAANFRNQRKFDGLRALQAPVPLPVVPVPQPATQRNLRLPNGQVWVTRKPTDWAAKVNDANDAMLLKTIFDGITEIKPDTKVFRVLIGFVAMSDGTFGLVDGVTGDTVPELPIIGRWSFQRDVYRSRDIGLDGQPADQLSEKAVVWCLNTNKRAEKRVRLADFWVAIAKPKPLMPPPDFLVEDN
ncbi:coat protein [Blackberry chlorotic ringspot virus]|uniref:Coat protein n=1 Tax=Blackberry chlorotic ringspot virus TaxID=339420 RepID=Q2QF32_9BROM|nr:coat protein [Blackberry chlorotic ringspot virus]AAZ42394.1 coat protein [Blackberry chlorotic ringspot virus]